MFKSVYDSCSARNDCPCDVRWPGQCKAAKLGPRRRHPVRCSTVTISTLARLVLWVVGCVGVVRGCLADQGKQSASHISRIYTRSRYRNLVFRLLPCGMWHRDHYRSTSRDYGKLGYKQIARNMGRIQSKVNAGLHSSSADAGTAPAARLNRLPPSFQQSKPRLKSFDVASSSSRMECLESQPSGVRLTQTSHRVRG